MFNGVITEQLIMKRFFKTAIAVAMLLSVVSCGNKTWKNIYYLQDVREETTMRMPINEGIIIQPQDQLSILVTCTEPKLAANFNLAVATFQAGSSGGNMTSGNNRITPYNVDNNGDIDFPSLGKIHVAGLSRWELQEMIKEKLDESGMLRDAVVIVEFLNFKISVLGDVASPGTFNISGDKITIFQALSLSHDLTIHGKRDDVMVIREQNGKRQIYMLDLRSSDVFNSPAYYLQQNDIVYVTPDKVKVGQSTINENYFRSASFWISLTSTAMTITNFVIMLLSLNK